MWARYARIIRSQILQVREEDYVDAARAIGDSKFGIIRRDILPNSITPVAVQATLDMGHALLLGATLAFIGLSVAGQAEWGTLVSEGQADIVAGRWWTSTIPGPWCSSGRSRSTWSVTVCATSRPPHRIALRLSQRYLIPVPVLNTTTRSLPSIQP